MGTDALDHAGRKPKFSKKDKVAFAKKKQEEEISAAVKDPKIVKESSKKFKARIKAERERLGLPTIEEPAPAPEKPLPTWIDTKRYETIEIKVDLEKEEKDAAGLELAFKRNQRADVENAQKTPSEGTFSQNRLKEIDVQMDILTTKATLGWEYRKFSCQLFLDFTTKERVYKDRETLKELKREGLKADDYQMRLPA